ncbi:ATP-binding protein [Nitrosomonas marina]|uniref:Sensory/regulatory protein RpfC n=1 Tax=Nitrosomonas marina TaxID=917 RepID=A0A1H8FH79_9PROT|nr:ATP-binding protein [Nitrosomonas marina]SEN30438.1 PAS domain S-box-containing protein [Nitrosomonas marina]
MEKDILKLDQGTLGPRAKLSCFLARFFPSKKTLLIALIYFTCAYFTRLFNFTEYYNVFVGIPAGLAFAIFVIWGTRLWQCIWLSAAAAHLLHNLSQVNDVESISINLFASLLTASGAVLQALVGVYLAKHFIKNSKKNLNFGKTTALLCGAGPIACLISSTIDTFVLYQFYGLQENAILSNWMSGYALDILGVLISSPVIFYTKSCIQFGNNWRRQILIVTISLIGIASLLLAGLFLFSHDSARNSHILFKEKTNEINLHLINVIKANEERLRNIGALVKSNDKLTSSEFIIFNQSAGLRKCVISFSWIPDKGLSQSDEIFEHQLIYPENYKVDLYGSNFAEQISRQAMRRSIKTGQLALAKSTNTNKQSWWLIYPVFTDNSLNLDTEQFATNKFIGFAAAQIDMQLFFEDLILKADFMNIALRIKGMASWHSSKIILEHNVPAQPTPGIKYPVSKNFAGEGLQIEMWNLHNHEFSWQTGPIILLFFGLIIMMLISAYSLNTIGHGFYLERQIKKRTREIELQNAKTSALVENLKDVAFTMDKNGIVQSVNPAVTTIFGYAIREVIGFSISLLIPEMLCSKHNCWLQSIDTESAELEKEIKAQHKNGNFFPVYLIICKYSVNGELYFLGVLHDLSGQKRLVSDVEAARDKAEAASRAKSEFLAAMSHEIRTPMNGVIGMLEVLIQSSLRPDQIEIVELVSDSANSLLGIINDILDFSKIEAGKLQITNELFSIEKETEKVCALLDRMADQKNVELLFFVEPEIPDQLQGDALRIRQILYNLVNNAIKFSSKVTRKGRVLVHVRLESSALGKVWLKCEVHDNGIGMSKAVMSRLFAAFEQGESSTTRRFGGTGLGLAISRQLAHMMGGTITVHSKLDEGSTFTVRLPLTQLLCFNQNESTPLANLSCLTIGSEDGFISFIARHLSHAGANVQHTKYIDYIKVNEENLTEKPWIWLFDAKENFSLELIRSITNQYSQQNVRIVVIGRGRRRKPRYVGDNIFLIDANVLTRHTLLSTVALAADLTLDEMLSSEKESCQSNTEKIDPGNILCLDNPILVAEDNDVNQKVIQRQLALLGVKADLANDGREALRLWKTNEYALVLTDVHMPNLDGYQLTAAIRAEEAKTNLTRTPIIALTANVLRGEAEQCKKIGMDDYLSKPAQLSVLRETIKKWHKQSKTGMLASPKNQSVKSNPEIKPIDVNILRELVGNDQTVIHELLTEFLTSAANIERELQLACEALDCEQATRAAHKLKSSARTVGALRLGDLCQQIEQAGKNGKSKLLKDLYTKFKLEMIYVNNHLIPLNRTAQ